VDREEDHSEEHESVEEVHELDEGCEDYGPDAVGVLDREHVD
jgi:hypothetical protein